MDGRWLFVNINNSGWWLKILSILQLAEYEDHNSSRYASAFSDYINKEQGSEFSQKIGEYALACATNEGESPMVTYSKIHARAAGGKLELLEQNGFVYVNSNGGFNSSFKPEEETQFVFRDKMVFPQYTKEDIQIKQWGDGGLHYYAYIGDLHLRDGDNFKFNHEKEAYEFALQYINQ